MEFIDIVNKGGGKFLSRYDVNYKDGEILRTYEMFSRDQIGRASCRERV